MNGKKLEKKIDRNKEVKIEQENQKGERKMRKCIVVLLIVLIIMLAQTNLLAQKPSLILPLKLDQTYRVTVGYGGVCDNGVFVMIIIMAIISMLWILAILLIILIHQF